MNWLKNRIDFVGDEPGTLLILLVLACYLLFFPGGACSIQVDDGAEHGAHEAGPADSSAEHPVEHP
jgi:hypothetical protein